MSEIDSPATRHSVADLNHQQRCCWNFRSLTQCISFFVHFTGIFLLLSMSPAHFNYNIQSQIKQVVTVIMPFRPESITSSTMCLQCNKCLFTGVTKTANCKIRLWNLFVNILSFSLLHPWCSTANLNSKWYLVHTHTHTHTYKGMEFCLVPYAMVQNNYNGMGRHISHLEKCHTNIIFA